MTTQNMQLQRQRQPQPQVPSTALRTGSSTRSARFRMTNVVRYFDIPPSPQSEKRWMTSGDGWDVWFFPTHRFAMDGAPELWFWIKGKKQRQPRGLPLLRCWVEACLCG